MIFKWFQSLKLLLLLLLGTRGGAVVEALRYKPEGREFDS
jgi:hypothetical protein